jgi:cytochrome d ubiquinol oxidase subunit I
MRYELSIPNLSSVIFGLGWNGAMEGLDVVPDAEEPPVAVIFWSFRVMVGLGFLMVGAGLWGLLSRWRGNLYASPWLWRAMVAMGPSGLVAVIAGWITTEVGRQPYVVYNQLRTADAVSPLGASAVGWSLIAFIVIYFAVFGAGVLYILRLMHREPDIGEPDADAEPGPTRAAGITPQQQFDRGPSAPAE